MTGQPDAGGQDGPGRERSDRQAPPGADILTEVQRWLIRSGAKSVRKEFGGQVRKTFGGGRQSSADVWDTATSEPPPEAGEAPECQWCPICRAARRMRESGPGLSGQLAGAGDAVAAAVHEAVKVFDSLLARATSYDAERAGTNTRDATARTEPQAGPGADAGPRPDPQPGPRPEPQPEPRPEPRPEPEPGPEPGRIEDGPGYGPSDRG